MKYTPYDYSLYVIDHILEHPASGLLLDMGLGKTAITLTAIDRLMYDRLEVKKVLIIAPKWVAEHTWGEEIVKWDHLKHFRLSKVLGSEQQRIAALRAKADLYIVNRENVPWLVAFYQSKFPFDMVVIDELSSFKSAKAIRFRALRQVRPLIDRIVGLTGTVAPNGLIDLWSQMYLLDQGERLGKTITGYRKQWFTPGQTKGHVVFNYNIKKEAEQEIYDAIGDICISMKSEDYIKLPERIDRIVPIKFSSALQKKYVEFEKSQILALNDVDEITAMNAAALSGKLLQFTSGAIYDNDDKSISHRIHDEKLKVLGEIVEAAQSPLLVFCWFKHEATRIMQYLKGENTRYLKAKKDIDEWNAGKIKVMLLNPASAGHGLNLQFGGNTVVWYSLTWALELYQQANKRIHRPGQKNTVFAHHLIAQNTIDQDVMKALERKAKGQDALMEAVKARIKKYLQVI